MKTFKEFINESSLSRIWSHAQKYDTGVITAFRGEEYDNKDIVKTYTKTENLENNKKLRAILRRLKYGVIEVHGTYVENYNSPQAKEVKEESFFVFDKEQTGKLKSDLKKLANYYKQDSVLFIPKNGTDAYLFGTKKDEYNNKFAFPGYGKEIYYNKSGWGIANEFMTKKKNQPFSFTQDSIKECNAPNTFMGKMGEHGVACEEALKIDEDIYKRIKQ